MPTLRKRDMVDKNGKCILPYKLPKKYQKTSRYTPAIEDKKHHDEKEKANANMQ